MRSDAVDSWPDAAARDRLPAPCPGDLVPDIIDQFDAAYRAAEAQRAA